MNRLQAIPERIDAIAVGASAGGAAALAMLLSSIPECAAVSVFIVLHLPRNRESLLVSIFEKRCPLALREAHDKDAIERGCVYFAPPDYHLLIDDGPQFALSIDEPVCYSRPSIDVLFQSAAAVYRQRLLGVVLTGANDDGAAGLKTITDAGGIAIVQDPSTAYSSFMPSAALQAVPDATVLTLEEIAQVMKTIRTEVCE
jgi:two-component system, chemotaxis family, protein-glutamate methylesterase/glutaminase